MNITLHNECLTKAKNLRAANPEMEIEMDRRTAAGEFFREGEPVTKFWRELNRLNKMALKAVRC
jgi:hypothetical protein